MRDTMRAVQIKQYGDVDVLEVAQVPRPAPQADEVLIRVHAAGVNPIDAKTRQGHGVSPTGDDPFPLILGWDVAGEVVAVGDNVSEFAPGDGVYGMPRFPQFASAYAEYVTAPASDIAHKPTSIDYVQAAAMPLVTLTAWQALFEAADLQAEQHILIHAAAGGVGHVAVQLAKWKGAAVSGTASGANEDFLQEMGVDQVIDYTTTAFEDVVGQVDAVLMPLAGETRERSWQVLKPGGVMVSLVGQPPEAEYADYDVRAERVLVRPNAAQLTQIAALVDMGYLSVAISEVLPLKKAQEAHTHIESGHTRSKIVLQVV